jgi:hypothetical protein
MVLVRKELVERRIERPDRDGPLPHLLEYSAKIVPLHGQKLRESPGAPFDVAAAPTDERGMVVASRQTNIRVNVSAENFAKPISAMWKRRWRSFQV